MSGRDGDGGWIEAPAGVSKGGTPTEWTVYTLMSNPYPLNHFLLYQPLPLAPT